MTKRQAISLALSVVVLAGLLLFMLFSERGLAEMNSLKAEQERLSRINRGLIEENIGLGSEIDRLKHDTVYIESIARREFGMIGREEILVKPQRPSGP